MDCDVVIVGGGHNGLTCGAYLARAGADVVVLERRGLVGGCATSEPEIAAEPEFTFNPGKEPSVDQTDDLKNALRYRNQQLTAQRGKAAPMK